MFFVGKVADAFIVMHLRHDEIFHPVALVQIAFDADFVTLHFKDRWVGDVLRVTLDLQYHINVAVLTRERDRDPADRTPDHAYMISTTYR